MRKSKNKGEEETLASDNAEVASDGEEVAAEVAATETTAENSSENE